MSDEMKREIIKAAAMEYSAEEISDVLGTDLEETRVIIAKNQDEIDAEIDYRKEM